MGEKIFWGDTQIQLTSVIFQNNNKIAYESTITLIGIALF